MSGMPQRILPRAVNVNIKKFRFVDFLAIVICLFGTSYGFYLFYISLNQTLSSNLEPVGTVTVKYNSIQRRLGDRILWDRLQNESPIYPGDIIRVAELSGATLNFDGNKIDLEENTLIRVQLYNGQPQIELTTGTISLDTGYGSGSISLIIDGLMIEAEEGTVLSVAAAADGGMALNVREGNAALTEGRGIRREADAGTVLAITPNVTGSFEIAAVIPEIEIIQEAAAAAVDLFVIDDSAESTAAEELSLGDFFNEILLAMGIEPVVEPEVIVRTAEPEPEPEPVVVVVPEPVIIQPLPAPLNRQPVNRYTIEPNEFRNLNSIVFRWSPVSGANAYIFTLLHQTASGRRQIVRSGFLTNVSYTLTNKNLLDRGTFIWQVEAINRTGSEINRRGYIGENILILDIPVPEPVQPHVTGRLYGQ
ncbi:MAG: hypothetical protein FWD24_05795 [Treponema sp.]|nr:hypothetical protein [Treponema sp.]